MHLTLEELKLRTQLRLHSAATAVPPMSADGFIDISAACFKREIFIKVPWAAAREHPTCLWYGPPEIGRRWIALTSSRQPLVRGRTEATKMRR